MTETTIDPPWLRRLSEADQKIARLCLAHWGELTVVRIARAAAGRAAGRAARGRPALDLGALPEQVEHLVRRGMKLTAAARQVSETAPLGLFASREAMRTKLIAAGRSRLGSLPARRSLRARRSWREADLGLLEAKLNGADPAWLRALQKIEKPFLFDPGSSARLLDHVKRFHIESGDDIYRFMCAFPEETDHLAYGEIFALYKRVRDFIALSERKING